MMATAKCSDEEFIALIREHGPAETSRMLGIAIRCVYDRRNRLQRIHDIIIKSPVRLIDPPDWSPDYKIRRHFEIRNGILMVISDLHIYPGYIPTACRAFIEVAKELKPKAVEFNGDVLDFPKASRHAPIGWSRKPDINAELECVSEYEHAVRKQSKADLFIWNLGNHDYRFENRLADKVPEYSGVEGTRLRDHFPHWDIGISAWFNNELVTKHRFKGGIHARHNNTLYAGKSMLTGHLHALGVTPFDDYNGTRWGIDSGTGNDPNGPHAEYTEDNPLNHRSGFIVVTFAGGKMLQPEICRVVDKKTVDFRGELISV